MMRCAVRMHVRYDSRSGLMRETRQLHGRGHSLQRQSQQQKASKEEAKAWHGWDFTGQRGALCTLPLWEGQAHGLQEIVVQRNEPQFSRSLRARHGNSSQGIQPSACARCSLTRKKTATAAKTRKQQHASVGQASIEPPPARRKRTTAKISERGTHRHLRRHSLELEDWGGIEKATPDRDLLRVVNG